MGLSRNKIALIATLATAWPSLASPQASGGGLGYQQGLPPQTATGVAAQGTQAQAAGAAQGGGGLQFDFGIDTSLRADDNFQLTPNSQGNSFIWDTRLNFGLTSTTPSSSFSLTGSGVLRFADLPGRTPAGFEDPNVRLRYTIDRKDTRLSLDARYRHADREFLNPFQVEQEEQNSGGLVSDGGTVTFINAGVRFETGVSAPFGLTFSARHDDKNYTNSTNPRLFDTTSDTAGVTARFDVSPVTQVTANAQKTWYSANDAAQTDRETIDLSVGLRQDINPALVLNASLGHTQIDTIKSGTPSTRSGLTGQVGLTQTFANGTVGVSLSTSQTVNGARSTLQFSRSLTLPRGTLSTSLGLTHSQSGSTDWIGRVAYSYQLASSNFNASLSRGSNTNNSDEDVIDTRIALGYSYDIDNVSRVNLTLNYGLSDDGGAGASPRVERTTFDAAYSRSLTADWNLRGGITIRHLEDSSASGPAHSNAVFLSLNRNFSFRP
ncbi:MAG: hypothetical protein ACKVPY_01440 [Paracoccaceae bacterium]